MIETKQKTLERLYKLRANWEILMETSNKAKPIHRDIEEEGYIIEDIENTKETAKNNAEERKTRYNDNLKEYSDEITYFTPRLESKRKKYENSRSGYSGNKKFIIFSVVIFALGIIFKVLGDEAGDIISGLSNILLIVSTVWGICSLLGLGGKLSQMNKDKEEFEKENKQFIKISNEYNELAENKNREFKKISHEAEEFISKCNANIEESKEKIKKLSTDLQPFIDRYNETYNSMKEQFSDLVKEEDWEKINLIIFNYESGRALDIREALIQTDNELQHKEMINAYKLLSNTLSNKLLALITALEANNSKMNNISRYTEKLAAQNDTLKAELAKAASSQQELMNKMNAQNAELAKTNAEMAKDMKRMRDLADHHEWGY